MIPHAMKPSREDEQRGQAEFYAGLADGELEKIAADGASLTELARAALQAEIVKRDLNVSVAGAPTGEDVLEQRKLVLIKRFRDLPEAMLAKGVLDSAQIECFLADENIVRMDWYYSNLIGGVKLLVDEEQAAEALELLQQPIPAAFELPDGSEFVQPQCPRCQSLDVKFQQVNTGVALGTMWALYVPLFIYDRAWKCLACGAKWEEVPENKTA